MVCLKNLSPVTLGKGQFKVKVEKHIYIIPGKYFYHRSSIVNNSGRYAEHKVVPVNAMKFCDLGERVHLVSNLKNT